MKRLLFGLGVLFALTGPVPANDGKVKFWPALAAS